MNRKQTWFLGFLAVAFTIITSWIAAVIKKRLFVDTLFIVLKSYLLLAIGFVVLGAIIILINEIYYSLS